MADNRCGLSIVHLKKESNKSIFLPEEPRNIKKGWQTDVYQRGYVTGQTRRDNTPQNILEHVICEEGVNTTVLLWSLSNRLPFHSMDLGRRWFLSDTSNYTRSFQLGGVSSRLVSHGHWFRRGVR
ncbi:hypothetical protein TNCV_2743051 [Trichonephila clavipes]|nr:hypothetical protein TNCV_2743051 [Trichonephila clavipes]